MPELPEVETVVRGLRPIVEGRRIRSCRHASAMMARCDGGDFRRRLHGQEIMRLDRHGKWMFFRLGGGDTLAIHLGMTGHLGIEPRLQCPMDHTHLRVALDTGETELRLRDPRRFGELVLCGPKTAAERFGPNRLGPEATQVTTGELRQILGRTKRRVKGVLLDQSAIAGIGNIYADEILFDAGIDPAHRGCDLGGEAVTALRQSIRRVLTRAIRAGGSTIRNYVNANGEPGGFQHYHRVYGRATLACERCSAPIELSRTVVVGRSTHYCRVCQV